MPVDLADRADTARRPGLALPGAQAHAVERGGDILVRPSRRHASHHGQRLLRRPAAVLARPRLPDPQAANAGRRASGSSATTSRAASSTSAMMPVTSARSSSWRARVVTPGAVHAEARSAARPAKSGTGAAGSGRVQRREARAAGLHAPQRVLPVLLELRRDQAVVGIAGRVAALRQRGFVERLPQIELDDPPSFGLPLPVHPLGFQRRLDRHRLHDAQYLRRDGGVHAGAAEAQAARQSQRQVGPVAAIDRAARRRPRVGDGQAAGRSGRK